MLLTPSEAAEVAGVPEVQLRRWAYVEVGPRNIGTKLRPQYLEEDVLKWRRERSTRQ